MRIPEALVPYTGFEVIDARPEPDGACARSSPWSRRHAALAELAAAVAPVRAARPRPALDARRAVAPHAGVPRRHRGRRLDDGVLPALAERLARAARRHPPVELALGGGGRFGDRVLWTRVHDLAADARRGPHRCARASPARSERRPGGAASRSTTGPTARTSPSPAAAPAPTCGRPSTALRGFAGTPWTADALHLVRSRLGAGPGGTAAHEVVATWRLGTQNSRT